MSRRVSRSWRSVRACRRARPGSGRRGRRLLRRRPGHHDDRGVAGNHRLDAPTTISWSAAPQPSGVERVEVRVAAPAPGQFARRPRPGPRRIGRGSGRRTRSGSSPMRPCPPCGPPSAAPGTRPWDRPAAVHPQVVGELVQVPDRAGQQVPGRHGGTPGRALLRRVRPARARSVLEAGQVGAERMRVGVAELGQQPEHVASRAAQPLREDPGRDTEVIAFTGERNPLGLPRERPELGPGRAQQHADDVAQPGCLDPGAARRGAARSGPSHPARRA